MCNLERLGLKVKTLLDSAELTLNADQVKASIRNTLAKDSAYYFSLLQDCETQQECLEAMAEFIGDTDLPIESKRGFYNDTLTFYKWQEAEIYRSIYADFIVLCDITANELLEWSALELTRLAQEFQARFTPQNKETQWKH